MSKVGLDPRAGQIEELTAWLASADARAAAEAEVALVGLRGRGHVDDLLADAWLEVSDRIASDPLQPEGAGGGVRAHARRVLRNAAVDLIRAPTVTSLALLIDGGWELGEWDPDLGDATGLADHQEAENPDLDSELDPDLDADLDADLTEALTVELIRQGLHRRLPERHVDPWVVSAALTAITLRTGEVTLADDVDQPADASPDWARRHLWAGLSYAGQGRCFEQPETGAVRDRRSRALERVERLLREEIDRALPLVTGRAP